MKVLITTDTFSPTISGVVTSVTNLYTELRRMGHDVRILTLSTTNQSVKSDHVYYIKSFGIDVYPNFRATVSFHDKYLKEILEWSPDIIHSQCEFFTFVYARKISKRLNIPIVHTYHTMYEHYTNYVIKNQRVGRKLVSVFSRRVMKHVRTVIAPTEKVKASLVQYGIEKDIEVVPTGIDLSKFRKAVPTEEKEALKNALGINDIDRIILSVGRLGEEKNIDEILFNLTMLLERQRNVVLLLVGDGPYRRELEHKAQSLQIGDHVIFAGMVEPERISAYYQLADIFVSASVSETQGLTYIEALANGLPEICKYDKCLDGVLVSGNNGFTYETSEEFVEYMSCLLENEGLRSEISVNAKASAEKFDSIAFVRTMEGLYQELTVKDSYSAARTCYTYA
jgi:1,2-diacylglycerol 3-alpha-glucosyltransferase